VTTGDVDTLGALLDRACESHGPQPFVTFGETTVTYSGALAEIDRYASAYAALGLRHGEPVALCLPNGLAFLWSWLALSRLGAIEVPLNPAFKARQLSHALNTAQARVIIVEELVAPVLSELGPEVQLDLIVVDGEPSEIARKGARVVSLREALAAAPSSPPDFPPVQGRDLVAILQTSGTTGLPKGVLLCHQHEVVLGRNIAADMELTSRDVFYNFFPLFHNTAQGIITVACLHAGARMLLTERFSVSRFWADVAAHGCTAFYYMGSMLKLLLEQAKQTPLDENSLRVGWGIAASDGDIAAFSERFGVRLSGGYGSTEANIPVFFPREGREAGSIGRVIPGWRVEVVDEGDAIVPPGTHGELVVRPEEPFTIMQGYANDPAETVAAWRNLWFHTGDGGYKDEEGNLFFGDRIRDVIRRRGETISSFEVEQIVLNVPGVLDCAAVPVPAEHGEDEVKVVLVGDTKRPSYEAIIAHCEAHLPSYAVPRFLEWSTVLPKTETGKTKKQELRTTPFNSSTWDRVTHETTPGG
jgi:crotonobetaine/carnitine-CoA ligase